MSVADRELLPALGATLNATLPGPLPFAPDVTVSHAALLDAVHPQPLPTLTATDPLPPAATNAWLLVERLTVQFTTGPAACVTVKICPPMVTLAMRPGAVGLTAALNATVPLPVPLLPEVTVSHAASLLAVQLQVPAAVTATDPVPPAAATACAVVASATEHSGSTCAA